MAASRGKACYVPDETTITATQAASIPTVSFVENVGARMLRRLWVAPLDDPTPNSSRTGIVKTDANGIGMVYPQENKNLYERIAGGNPNRGAVLSELPLDTPPAAKPDALTNKGWKNGTVVGASANILLNPIDESAAASMRGSMGLGYIYLSPYMEIVRTSSKEGASFGRTTYGLGFTFETTH